MKRWKSLTAALCAAVLLCGVCAVPAFAYADGGEGENYGDPTMTEETTAPEPEPTIEPGEGFSEEGNLVTRDLLYDEHTNKQFRPWLWPVGAVFCNGRIPLSGQLPRTAKTGICPTAFYPVSACKSGGRFVAGADNCYL